MAPTEMERGTLLARHELRGADPREHRAVLDEVKRSLQDLDARTRRKAQLLVTALAIQWSTLMPGPKEKMKLRFDVAPDRLRIAATASERAMPVAFWEVVGGAAATAFADHWEMARDGSGAWFDIERISS